MWQMHMRQFRSINNICFEIKGVRLSRLNADYRPFSLCPFSLKLQTTISNCTVLVLLCHTLMLNPSFCTYVIPSSFRENQKSRCRFQGFSFVDSNRVLFVFKQNLNNNFLCKRNLATLTRVNCTKIMLNPQVGHVSISVSKSVLWLLKHMHICCWKTGQ